MHAFVDLRDRGAPSLKRLALFALDADQTKAGPAVHRFSGSTDEEIDCGMTVGEADMEAFRRVGNGYVTYRETVEKTDVRTSLDRTVAFECFQGKYAPPLDDLCTGLREDQSDAPPAGGANHNVRH